MTKKFPEAFFFNTLEKPDNKNMLVAISCNKKASEIITEQCAIDIITQSAEFTNKNIGIFIADEIMKYNEIAANKSPQKAHDIAMKYGDYFFDLFNGVIEKLPLSIVNRISILRYSDVANHEHEKNVEKVKKIYLENNCLKAEIDKAATQLLKWRCAEYAPNQKRINAILNFMFREIPIVGAWDDITIKGMDYQGIIYPAINPRGMGIIAKSISEFDKIIGSAQRLLLVMHISDEGVLA